MKKALKKLGNYMSIIGGVIIGVGIASFSMDTFEIRSVLLSGLHIGISFLVFGGLSIVLHEAGHLAGGLITGYGFVSFRIGSWVWVKEDERIRFKVSESIVAGQCLMAPPADFAKFRYLLYNLGGVIANLLLAAICLMLTFVLPREHILNDAFFTGFLVNVLLVLTNAIPIRALTNDGANVLETLKSPDAKRGLYLLFYVNQATTQGMRYRDLDESLFVVDEQMNLNNYITAYRVLFAAARLYDLGCYDESIAVLDDLPIYKLPGALRLGVLAEQLSYYTIHSIDHARARELYEHKKLQAFLNIGLPQCMRVLAAYTFFVLDNREKGRELLQNAKISLENFPNKGERIMESEYMTALEARMEALSAPPHAVEDTIDTDEINSSDKKENENENA